MAGQRTLLQDTALRGRDRGFLPPLVATSEEQRFFVAEQLAEVGIEPSVILLEPAARNTAPAIALGCLWSLARGEDYPLLVMPSDQIITDQASFVDAAINAVPAAQNGSLVTFGIRPTSPHTGYGYIRAQADGLAASCLPEGIRPLDAFVEKPDVESARTLIHEGCLWNAGIFLFRPSAFLRELARFEPQMLNLATRAMKGSSIDGFFVRPLASEFAALDSKSIDYAVMEHTKSAVVVEVDAGWSDVGSWDAVHALHAHDEHGNAILGDVVTHDVKDCIIQSEGQLVVGALGLNNIVCIVTPDAVLIADRDRSQDVRILVDRLRDRGDSRADESAVVFRPWGSYQTMDRGHRFQTKRIIVKPKASLSLQKHVHRSEHWIVVAGTAEVTIGDRSWLVQENESTYIPAGTQHRLTNPGAIPLHLIEVQCGSYLGEDDIIRLDDQYGRH